MNLVTRQDLANAAANRWLIQYGRPSGQISADREETHKALIALGATPNPDDVDAVIGNDSWTHEQCSHCGERADRLVSIDVTGGEYGTRLCEACVDKMKKLFQP